MGALTLAPLHECAWCPNLAPVLMYGDLCPECAGKRAQYDALCDSFSKAFRYGVTALVEQWAERQLKRGQDLAVVQEITGWAANSEAVGHREVEDFSRELLQRVNRLTEERWKPTICGCCEQILTAEEFAGEGTCAACVADNERYLAAEADLNQRARAALLPLLPGWAAHWTAQGMDPDVLTGMFGGGRFDFADGPDIEAAVKAGAAPT